MTDDTFESRSLASIGGVSDGDIETPSDQTVREAIALLEATDFREYLAAKSNISSSVEERMESETEAEFLSSLQDSTDESNDGEQDDG